MPRTAADVKSEAIELLSVSYADFDYSDDATFQVWVQKVVDRVIESFSGKVGDSWGLDELNCYLASLYETMALIIERRLARAYGAAAESQNITVGPISISAASSGNILKEWGWNANRYHQLAWARLMAMGVGRRTAMLKVFGAKEDWERLDHNHPVPSP